MLNYGNVKKFIENKINEKKPYYTKEKEIFNNMVVSVNGGSFGACLVSIQNDFYIVSNRYVSNYKQIEALTGDFIFQSLFRLYQKAFSNDYKIEQLEHANQFVIKNGNKIIFQSYASQVATYNRATKTLILGYDWDYSNTTLRHLYLFLDWYCCLTAEQENALKKYPHNKKRGIYEGIKNGVFLYDSDMR